MKIISVEVDWDDVKRFIREKIVELDDNCCYVFTRKGRELVGVIFLRRSRRERLPSGKAKEKR